MQKSLVWYATLRGVGTNCTPPSDYVAAWQGRTGPLTEVHRPCISTAADCSALPLLTPCRHRRSKFFALRGALLDNLVGRRQQRFGDGEAERLGGVEIDDQLELGRQLDW